MLVCFYYSRAGGGNNNSGEQQMLRVLMFLFENYGEHHGKLISDQEALSGELAKAGFNKFEIRDALSWLEGFKALDIEAKTFPTMSQYSIRFYDADEKMKIDEEARSLLYFLEQSDVLTPHVRELAIDRAMAMEEFIDVAQMKWILLITLFYHPSEKSASDWMQDLVLHGDILH